MGWITQRNDRKIKIFIKGNKKISVVRVDKNKWKLEVFEKDKILDGLGINDEPSAKILICELGILRGIGR